MTRPSNPNVDEMEICPLSTEDPGLDLEIVFESDASIHAIESKLEESPHFAKSCRYVVFDVMPEWEVDEAQIVRLLNLIPRLTKMWTLTVSSVYQEIGAVLPFPIYSLIQDIDWGFLVRLSLVCVHFETLEQLHELVWSFSDVTYIHLDSVTWSCAGGPVDRASFSGTSENLYKVKLENVRPMRSALEIFRHASEIMKLTLQPGEDDDSVYNDLGEFKELERIKLILDESTYDTMPTVLENMVLPHDSISLRLALKRVTRQAAHSLLARWNLRELLMRNATRPAKFRLDLYLDEDTPEDLEPWYEEFRRYFDNLKFGGLFELRLRMAERRCYECRSQNRTLPYAVPDTEKPLAAGTSCADLPDEPMSDYE